MKIKCTMEFQIYLIHYGYSGCVVSEIDSTKIGKSILCRNMMDKIDFYEIIIEILLFNLS